MSSLLDTVVWWLRSRQRPECTRQEGHSEAEFLHFAHDHLASAKVLFKESPTCYDSAGGLSHLGVELILKAVLLHFADGFPRVHDLRRLRGRAEQVVPGFRFSHAERDTLNSLNRWFPLRYPDPDGSQPIGGDQFEAVLALADRLIDQLPPDLQGEFRSSVSKGGRVLMRRPSSHAGAA